MPDHRIPLRRLEFTNVVGERGITMRVYDAAEVGFAEFETVCPARLGVADMQRLVDWGTQWIERAKAEAAAKAPSSGRAGIRP